MSDVFVVVCLTANVRGNDICVVFSSIAYMIHDKYVPLFRIMVSRLRAIQGAPLLFDM